MSQVVPGIPLCLASVLGTGGSGSGGADSEGLNLVHPAANTRCGWEPTTQDLCALTTRAGLPLPEDVLVKGGSLCASCRNCSCYFSLAVFKTAVVLVYKDGSKQKKKLVSVLTSSHGF